MSTLTAPRPRPVIRPAAAVGMIIKTISLLVFTWLFVWPLGMLVYGAFNSSPLSGNQTWTLAGFQRVLTDPDTFGSLGATMVYSIVITVLSMAVAIFFATVTTRMDVPFRRLITPVMVILVAMPTVLYSLSWAMLGAGPAGMINKFLDAISLDSLAAAFTTRSWFGLVLVTVLKASALAYMIILGAFRNQNSALEEAARISGAGRMRSFIGIELPALLPALGAASLFIFVKGLEAFETPAVLGQPAGIEVYATHIYDYLRGGYEADYSAASASSLVIVLILAVLVLAQLKLTGGGRTYTSVGGRSKGAALRKPGRWTVLVVAMTLFYFFIALVLPIIQVVLSAFQPYLGSQELTTQNFERLLETPNVMRALRTTIIVSTVGGLLTVVLALVVSFAFVRMRGRLGRFIQLASWVPAAMPGLVLGLAFLWSVLMTPGTRPLYGTVWILVIGLAVATVPLATRTLEGALAQISVDMEEASRIAGDSFLRAVTTVTVRLMGPSLISAWFLVAITMSGILDVPILLGSASTEMISTISFGFYNSGETVLASALYVIFTCAMAGLAGIAFLAWFIVRTLVSRSVTRPRAEELGVTS
ncbi:iron ABC transporter permease [Arthrobacter sp. zg-Y820]|uniref:ABC transporter permease n=1 Tax=unclassified Arthrobacter TaxID=235627 RepID=UPI001E2FDC88|nr:MULTISPECIES: iron ABC transporter permease [unclassified Arthrobacter]MCC9195673.1 iron ABC transporter permease [Arthrobacter sp. zg-Y820]MDK1278532.1 iron ABC transporter permease [Arthrobacter sp. zg.Y820]WIB09032.1 iron ABC transporter permease [Arthrobacter sp. zg-Y820]